MLPEQAIRSLPASLSLQSLAVSSLVVNAICESVTGKDGDGLDYHPHTLTGDEWRAAWADAQDAEIDKALDAVY